jgi:hypothetical protein
VVQCRVSGGGAPSNLRIVSGGIRSLRAISSAVGSRPITCRKFRQVRKILLKAAMVATDKWGSIILPRFLPPRLRGILRLSPLRGKLH